MASLIQELQRNGSVPLEAYSHQVGGHHLLVKFKKDTVCKPLITKEHLFYESIPSDVRVFTPGYHGVISIALDTLPSGEIKIVAYPRQNVPSNIDRSSLSCSTHKSIHLGEDAITSKAEDGAAYVSPWSAECKKITRDNLLTNGDETRTVNEDYLVLENLTSKFSAPSVLDLKIGTRQHGDDVPEEKVKKHKETCANSTSRTLGVRICGLQRYDAAKNEYIFRDKYYGRSLSEEGFHEELKSFLHNGLRFRSDLLPNIIHMLEELQRVIERQDSFRFFSSSLLIIYDGAECAGVNGVIVRGGQSGRVRVDTEETRTNGIATPPLSNHTHSPNGQHVNCPRDQSHTSNHGNAETTAISHISCIDLTFEPHNFEEMRKYIDVRMIDFGHTTHTGIGDSIKYTGPDDGYLFGLHSMIESFRQMLV